VRLQIPLYGTVLTEKIILLMERVAINTMGFPCTQKLVVQKGLRKD
jgi:hypothetical protein